MAELFTSESLTIMLIGAFVASACALVGCFLVLRKAAMLGDAISHAALPGIAIAFIVMGDWSAIGMVIGASTFGLITVFLVGLLNRTKRLGQDASIGVVFPALFSIGVILIARYAGSVDLDLDCVLYGEIAYAPLDLWQVAGLSLGPRALWVTGATLLLNLGMVVLLYKELKVTSFDPALAAAIGISPLLIHYLLMAGVSVTVVSSFESVGAILVVAMLVVPPATAYLLTDRLATMLILSVVFGVLSSTVGYILATLIDSSIAGAMATAAGFFFLSALLFSPKQGIIARTIRRQSIGRGFRQQLLLLHLQSDTVPTSQTKIAQRFAWSKGQSLAAIIALRQAGEIEGDDECIEITAKGRDAVETTGHGILVEHHRG
jgi:manganese/zinc/iron transport system permease protein